MPDFLVPDLGEGLEEATIVSWLASVGDEVTLNQPLCVLETAKAEVEVPSPYAGELAELGGVEGETLRVGTLLARIGEEMPARQATLVGYGHDPSLDKSRRRSPAPGNGSDSLVTKPLAKPPVRLLARRLGVDLASIAPGSGPGGIVARADVDAAHRAGDDATEPMSARDVVAVKGTRARIAERLSVSRTSIPDATCSVIADFSRLLELRDVLNGELSRREEPSLITPFSLLCRMAVLALREVPILNSTFVEDVPEIHVHRHIHLGVGTSTPRGLVVTVVRNADDLGMHLLSKEISRLSVAARAGEIDPTELQGSTFTISNFGALGLDDGVPIINHPEAAILGVGAIRPRPHVVNGEVVARPTAALTVAFDHRICDGAEAGAFLSALRRFIEAPELGLLS